MRKGLAKNRKWGVGCRRPWGKRGKAWRVLPGEKKVTKGYGHKDQTGNDLKGKRRQLRFKCNFQRKERRPKVEGSLPKRKSDSMNSGPKQGRIREGREWG